ncbi:MAG: hypothetical protein ACE141_18295 [Bryobacteraceae bacterium]
MQPFPGNSDGHGNVVFNFQGNPVGDLPAFAHGYHRAGKALAATLDAAPGYADYEGYPIFFVYRHALELYLKAVVYRGAMLLHLISECDLDTSRLFTSHRLAPLLPHVRAIWASQHWSFEGTRFGSFEHFESIIRWLDQVDPQSYSFRYPMSRTGEAQLPHHFVINVVSFSGTMDALLDLLAGAVTGLTEEFQLAAEARYELSQYFERQANTEEQNEGLR